MAKETYDLRAVAVWARYRDLINRAELARQLGISGVSVHNWKIVPEQRLKKVSEILGVPMETLRPDLADFLTEDPWEDL
jgi:hypothetical protein